MATFNCSMSPGGESDFGMASYDANVGGWQIGGNDDCAASLSCRLPNDYSKYANCTISGTFYSESAVPSSWGGEVLLSVNDVTRGGSISISGSNFSGSGHSVQFSISTSNFLGPLDTDEFEPYDTVKLVFYNADGEFTSSGKCLYLKSGSFYSAGATKEINLYFSANGGSGAPSSQTAEADNSGVAIFTVPSTELTRANYTFLGWSTSKSATTPSYEAGEDIELSEDTTLYAVWKPIVKYTLTFDANEGSGAPSSQTAEADDFGYASFKIPYTEPTREDYTFLGWDTSKSATWASYEAGEDIELSEDTTLYAVWTQIIKYTLTYNANGGSGAPSSQTAEADDFGYASFKIPYTTPTREDYTFLGWDTSKSATWASYKNGEIIEINTNTTLYAIWEKNPSYTLTFDANGGSGAPTKMSDVSDANGISSFKIPSTIPKRAGYIFDGWGESSDAIEPTYALNDTVTTTEDITLYAIWNLVVSIRVFKSGVLWTNCTRVLTLYSNNVLRYTLTSDGTGIYSAEYLEPDIYDLYVDGVDTGINVTLPHEDEVNPIKIQYHTVVYYASTADGGTVPKDANIYLNGTSVSILDNVGGLVKDDCLFVGWNTTKDGTGTHYNAGDVISITSSLKLYAIWIDDTINYVFDGAEYIPSDPIIHDEQGWKFAKMWVFTTDGWES